MGEDADLGVGQDKAADQIVFQITFDREAKWFLGQTAPRFTRSVVFVEASLELFFRNERLQHRVPRMFGEDARQIVKLLNLVVLGVASSKIDNRFPALLFIDVADEQPGLMTILNIRRKRPGRPPAQFELQAKIANDLLREQTDQIRIARQPRVVIGKNFLGSRRPANVIIFLQEKDAQSGAAE